MALLTPVSITKAGLADSSASLVAADVAGDSVKAASGVFIEVLNGDASPHTLTVAAPAATTQCSGYGALPVAALTLVVGAGDTGKISIPLNYAVSGEFAWTYDAITSVTVGVFSISP